MVMEGDDWFSSFGRGLVRFVLWSRWDHRPVGSVLVWTLPRQSTEPDGRDLLELFVGQFAAQVL